MNECLNILEFSPAGYDVAIFFPEWMTGSLTSELRSRRRGGGGGGPLARQGPLSHHRQGHRQAVRKSERERNADLLARLISVSAVWPTWGEPGEGRGPLCVDSLGCLPGKSGSKPGCRECWEVGGPGGPGGGLVCCKIPPGPEREQWALRTSLVTSGLSLSPRCFPHWPAGAVRPSPSWPVSADCRNSGPGLSLSPGLSRDSEPGSWPGSSSPQPGRGGPQCPPPLDTCSTNCLSKVSAPPPHPPTHPDVLSWAQSALRRWFYLSSLAALLFGSGDFFLLKSFAETASRLLWPGRYLALLRQNLHLRTFLMAPMLPLLSTSSEADGFWKYGVVGQY